MAHGITGTGSRAAAQPNSRRVYVQRQPGHSDARPVPDIFDHGDHVAFADGVDRPVAPACDQLAADEPADGACHAPAGSVLFQEGFGDSLEGVRLAHPFGFALDRDLDRGIDPALDQANPSAAMPRACSNESVG